MIEFKWLNVDYLLVDFQDIIYYVVFKKKKKFNSFDEVDLELLDIFNKFGILFDEQKMLAGVVVDVVIDLVFVKIIYKEKLVELGIIFCFFSEVVQEYFELIKKYIGFVVFVNDNYFVVLNFVVFSDGFFVYLFKGVKCFMELSIYFCINEWDIGQFECIFIVVEEGSQVSYLEGCMVLMCDENQLYVVVVEFVVMDDVIIKYFMV